MRSSYLPAFTLLASSLAVGCVPSAYEGGTPITDFDLVEPAPVEPPAPIEDVPDGVNDFLTSDDVADLESVGMTLYAGDDPPDIEGEYILDSLRVEYDDVSGAIGLPINEALLAFTNQTAAGDVDQSLLEPNASGAGSGGFVSGEGECFTVWINFLGYAEHDECNYVMPQVFSGCVNDSGISGLQFGYVMKSVDGPCWETVVPGHRRVMDEVDGLALRVEST